VAGIPVGLAHKILIWPQARLVLGNSFQGVCRNGAKSRIDLVTDHGAHVAGSLIGSASRLIVDVPGGQDSEIHVKPPRAIDQRVGLLKIVAKMGGGRFRRKSSCSLADHAQLIQCRRPRGKIS
jgi:hypothetical protein